MEALGLGLVLLAAVLVSSVIDQVVPKISSPLIQIALGVIIAIIAQGQISITLNPELFLVLFIAPLLFHEAREADKGSLWIHRRSLLSYAIGLVVAIALIVGFAVHWMIPSISLAAAFALGAALGPTDAVAVSSLSHDANLPERQQAILQGEALLNDASGIVSFQFAIAAAVTGSFSAASAVGEFAVEFFGGLVVGTLLGYLVNFCVRKIRDLGLENTTFHVLLEVFLPFIVFLIGQEVHVSGVIAVVVCGIVMSMARKNLGPSISHMNIVSNSVWHVLTFGLNGIVFVLLGTQLPAAVTTTWVDEGIGNVELIGYVIAITLLMHGTRFVWSIVAERLADRRHHETRTRAQRLRTALVTTLSGAKGTITLAIMFTIPRWIDAGTSMERFPNRDLLIFLACGVIVLSLLIATFIVPLLAPRKVDASAEHQRDLETAVDIMRAVIEELTAHQTGETRRATSEVIRRYNDRIARIQDEGNIDAPGDTELRIKVLTWEQEYVTELIEQEKINPIEGYQHLDRIRRIEAMTRKERRRLLSLASYIHRTAVAIRTLDARMRNKLPLLPDASESQQELRGIQIEVAKRVIMRLQSEMAESDIPTETYSALILEYQNFLSTLKAASPSITAITNSQSCDDQVLRLALRLELEQIQRAYEEERLSRAEARHLRQNVALMQLDLDDRL